MKISDYEYDYPKDSVAYYPPTIRGESSLFVVDTKTGEITIDKYRNFIKYLDKGDLVIRNNTKVFHARLKGKLFSNDNKFIRNIEVFLVEPRAQTLEEYLMRVFNPDAGGYELEFMGTLKKKYCKQGYIVELGGDLIIVNLKHSGDAYSGIFKRKSGDFSGEELFALIESNAEVPLPPYLKREANEEDEKRYQTIFAKKKGSVAAPTASLNFTDDIEILASNMGIGIEEVTLHVGRGTFLPLKNEDIEENKLHSEPFYISKDVSSKIKQTITSGNRVCALGTTVTRVLESSYENINNETGYMGDTNLFIYPPYNFQIVNSLLTNFHFPGSSLITLVDAFLQYRKSLISWRDVYEFAIDNDAKLFSYGDSMLIL